MMSPIDIGLEVLQFLASGAGALVVAVISILIAIYFYIKPRSGARIAYNYRQAKVLGGKGHRLPEKVKITYDDKEIPSLCRTLLLIWNNGYDTVLGASVVEGDTVSIDLGDVLVLDAEVIKVTKAVNGIRADLSNNSYGEVQITFDFMEPGDGFVVAVSHTDTDERPKIKGTVRGMPRGFKNFGRAFPDDRQRDVTLVLTAVLSYVLSMTLAVNIFFISWNTLQELSKSLAIDTIPGSTWFVAFIGVVIALLSFLFGTFCILKAQLSWRRYPRNLIVPEFQR